MKKMTFCMTVAALFISGAVNAQSLTQDASATVAVTGNITVEESCAVVLSKQSVTLNTKASDLVNEGEDASTIEPVTVNIVGTRDNNDCPDRIAEGRIGVKFTGTADNSEGSTFANTASQSDAAKGVGIGVFNKNKQPINANKGILQLGDYDVGIDEAEFGLQLVKLKNQTVSPGNILGMITVEIARL